MTKPSRPDARALRTAYLDLLKLCLCDLAGASTREVTWTGDRRVFSRTLTGEQQIDNRKLGKDWPLDGLTMVGMSRLDDLQACVESVVTDGVEGDMIEAGAWRGGASILIRATLDSLGAYDRTLWVADSFQGFAPPEASDPEADRELETHMSQIGFLAPSLETVKGYFERFGVADNVNFVPGYFEQTMVGLRGRRWSLVRLDADTYRATRVTLDALYWGLANGGYLVIDDYFHPYLPESCRRAVDDFRAEYSIDEPIEQIDWNGGRWRKRSEPEPMGETAAQTGESPGRPPAGDTDAPIPTDRELHLQDELAALRARLEEVEEQLRRRPDSPIAGLLARMRRSAGR